MRVWQTFGRLHTRPLVIENYDVGVAFEHLAVTSSQAIKFNLESAPQKATDNRGEYMPDTYQAEALDPNDLAIIVDTRLREIIGRAALAEAKKLTKADKRALRSVLANAFGQR